MVLQGIQIGMVVVVVIQYSVLTYQNLNCLLYILGNPARILLKMLYSTKYVAKTQHDEHVAFFHAHWLSSLGKRFKVDFVCSLMLILLLSACVLSSILVQSHRVWYRAKLPVQFRVTVSIEESCVTNDLIDLILILSHLEIHRLPLTWL